MQKYRNISYHNKSWDEEQFEVHDTEYFAERRRQSFVTSRIKLLCTSVLVCLIMSAVAIVVWTAVRTSDIRHHQVISEHQLSILNGHKTHAKPGECNSTIVLIRHCDKNGPNTTDSSGNEHCSLMGFERARFIPTLFGETRRWANPSSMYALSTNRPHVHHLNYREIETLSPLAQQAHVEINTKYSVGQEPYLADSVFKGLSSGKMCGNSTVICWKHSRMPLMSASLGCGPKQGCPTRYPRNDFDQVWTIHFVYNSSPKETSSNQRSLKSEKGVWTVHGDVEEEGFNADEGEKNKDKKHGK